MLKLPDIQFCDALDKLYVVGGSDGQTSMVTVEIYDPGQDSWTFGPSLGVPRANMGVIAMDRQLFAVGGLSGRSFLESIEYLCDDGNEWCSCLPTTNVSASAEIALTNDNVASPRSESVDNPIVRLADEKNGDCQH